MSNPHAAPKAMRTRRIQTIGRVMAPACTILAIALVGFMLFYWAVVPSERLLADARLAGLSFGDIGLGTRILACAVSMLPLGVLVWGLMQARHAFRSFSTGSLFGMDAVRGLRGLGLALLVSAVAKPFCGAALSVILSWNGAPGTRTLAFSLDSSSLIEIVFAALTMLIAWILSEAAAIADENTQFV
ncbi:DUF2975 domain-containing protein [Labrys neptuniae]